MPNHVTNQLTVTGSKETVADFLDSIKGTWDDDPESERPIDFNKILPMPESLRGTTEGGGYEFTLAKALCNQKGMFFPYEIDITDEKNLVAMTDDQWTHFKELVQNIRDHGYTSWYGWSIDNWGTKWNAYSQSYQVNAIGDHSVEAIIRFDTAWAGVPNLIRILMDKWRTLDFMYIYADEDSGNNVGRFYRGEDGYMDGDDIEDGSNDAYELYLALHPGADEYIRWNDAEGKYEYYDEEDEDEAA